MRHLHTPHNRLRPWQRRATDACGALLLLTGAVWLALHYGRGDELPLSAEAWALRLHGAAAFAALFMLGVLAAAHVPHGWRAAFSTIMNERAERLKIAADRAVIDMMLAHELKGMSSSESAYNRSSFMERRREAATAISIGNPSSGVIAGERNRSPRTEIRPS